MCERALSLVKESAVVYAELGHQLQLSGNSKSALKTFRQALDMQNGTPEILLGTVYICYHSQIEISFQNWLILSFLNLGTVICYL